MHLNILKQNFVICIFLLLKMCLIGVFVSLLEVWCPWLLLGPTKYDAMFCFEHKELKVEKQYVQSCMAFRLWHFVIIAVLCSWSEQGCVLHDWVRDAMDSASAGRKRASAREFALSVSSSERERWFATSRTSPNPALMRYDILTCKYKASRTPTVLGLITSLTLI